MMKTKTSIWFAAAIAAGFAFGFAGCGEPTPMPTTCTSDSQCGASEVCHTLLKSCVAACTSANDCPDSAKKCATLSGATAGADGGARGFCQCATDALCDRGTAGQVCQDKSTLVCAAKCTASSGCPTGFTCDTATGKCGTAAATDGGTDGGTMDAGVTSCTPGSCTAGQICNPTTSMCGAPAACSSANPQPDTCVYGLVCTGAACAEANRTGVTCGNFDMVATPKAWNPATVNPKGPVTVAMNSIAKDMNMPLFCGARGADFSADIILYAGNTNFPAMRDLVPMNFFNYVRTDGQIIDVARNAMPLVRATSGYANGLSNNNKNLTMKMNLCVSGTVPASIVAGFYAEGGNPVCSTLQ